MPACIQELHQRDLELPGPDRRRRDQPRLRPPGALPERPRVRRGLRARASSTARTPSPASTPSTRWSTPRPGRRSSRRSATRPRTLREKPVVVDDSPPTDRRLGPLGGQHDDADPRGRRYGVRDVDVDLDEVFPYLDRHVLFKLHWGGRGVKGEAWRKIVEGDGEEEGFNRKLERMWAEQDYLRAEGADRLLPVQRRRQRAGRLRPRGPRSRARAARLPAAAQARPDLPRRLLPPDRLRRARRRRPPGRDGRARGDATGSSSSSATASSPSSSSCTGSASSRPRGWPSGCTRRRGPSSGSRPRRVAATRGATRPARTSPSTRRSGACSGSRRSG